MDARNEPAGARVLHAGRIFGGRVVLGYLRRQPAWNRRRNAGIGRRLSRMRCRVVVWERRASVALLTAIVPRRTTIVPPINTIVSQLRAIVSQFTAIVSQLTAIVSQLRATASHRTPIVSLLTAIVTLPSAIAVPLTAIVARRTRIVAQRAAPGVRLPRDFLELSPLYPRAPKTTNSSILDRLRTLSR
jgi:hypothetical protein